MEPLSKADISKVRQAIAKTAETEQKVAKAKACGIECEEFDERCQLAKKFLIAVNEIYANQ